MHRHPHQSGAHAGHEALANMCQLLASSTRLKMLHLLQQGDRSTQQLIEMTGVTQPNVWAHMDKLLRAGLVLQRKDGKSWIYSLCPSTASKNYLALMQLVQADAQAANHRPVATPLVMEPSRIAGQRLVAY